MRISKDYLGKSKKNPHLHSPAHVLADELSRRLHDPGHFGLYLKAALENDHNLLRRLAGEALEGRSKNPGALFSFLLKKHRRESPVSRGYSLWLVPDTDSRRKLLNAMTALATAYQGPRFEPHVTLLDGLDELQASQAAGPPLFTEFECSLGAVQAGESFFRCLFLPVEKTKPLLAARRAYKKQLGIKSLTAYRPHLSLLYGNLDDSQKLQAIQSLSAPLPGRIRLAALQIVKTQGPAADWQTIKTINLHPHDNENRQNS